MNLQPILTQYTCLGKWGYFEVFIGKCWRVNRFCYRGDKKKKRVSFDLVGAQMK